MGRTDFQSGNLSEDCELADREFQCQHRLELILQNSQGFIVLFDVDSRIRFVNQQFASAFNVSPEQAIGTHIWEIIGDQDYAKSSRQRMERALGGESQNYQNEIVMPDGQLRPMIVTLNPDIGADGKLEGVLMFAVDISETVKTKNELERLHANFELTVKHSGVGIVELDDSRPDWVYTDHIEVLLGYQPGELKSSATAVRRLIHPDDKEINERINRERKAGRNIKFELRLCDSSENYRWFSIAFYGQPDPCGQTTRWVGTIADIDELKKSQLDAEKQVVCRDEFLAMLSHELRNPLMAIRYSVDLLTDFQKAKTDSKEFLNIISRQTTQISRILDDLLDVAQIAHNRIQYETVALDLNESIRFVLETVRSSFVDKQQKIRLDIAPVELLVDGDETRIKQAMINLMQNASKYTPVGGEIEIGSAIVDGKVEFKIRDTGQGIPEQDIEKIFDLFFRVKNSEDHTSTGMGVGLFLVKHVIEKHRGNVFVTSDGIGKGSVFRFLLPRSRSRRNRLPADYRVESSGGPRTVCIVEDIPDSRIAMKILLEHRGFEVFEFGDAESAVQRLPEIDPDVAIVDIGLPGKNGIELARELRNIHKMNNVFMIALTGYGQQADCEMIDSAGFNRHLVKPAGIREVCQVIAEFFERRERELAEN